MTAAILTASWRPAYAFLLVAEMVLVIGWWLVGRRGSPAPTPGAAVAATDGPGGGGIATAEPSRHSIEARVEPATEARASLPLRPDPDETLPCRAHGLAR